MAPHQTGPRRRKPGAGRRRDPTIDSRILHAARLLYATDGWAGLHFDGVARNAGVSKDAVYRRFADAKALLLAAISERNMPSLAEDVPLREALVDYAGAIFDYFTSGDGYANLRVHLDGPKHPEVLNSYRSDVVEPALHRDSAVLRRAQDAGRLSAGVDCEAAILAIGGAVMVLALAHGPDQYRPDPGYDHSSPGVLRNLKSIVAQVIPVSSYTRTTVTSD